MIQDSHKHNPDNRSGKVGGCRPALTIPQESSLVSAGCLQTGLVRWGIYLCFFMSGATALVFEVLWSRQFVTVFGSSPYAISVVLCAYMAGLGLGGLLGGWLADRIAHRVAAYGVIQGCVAASRHGDSPNTWLAEGFYSVIDGFVAREIGFRSSGTFFCRHTGPVRFVVRDTSGALSAYGSDAAIVSVRDYSIRPVYWFHI